MTGKPAFAIAASLALGSCVHHAATPNDPACPEWLPLRARAIVEQGAKNFASASDFAERSVRARFACDRSGAEPLKPEQRAAEAHDLLRAGEFAHRAGDARRATRLVREALREFDRALAVKHEPGPWVDTAYGDMDDAGESLEHDAWPRFDEPRSTEMR